MPSSFGRRMSAPSHTINRPAPHCDSGRLKCLEQVTAAVSRDAVAKNNAHRGGIAAGVVYGDWQAGRRMLPIDRSALRGDARLRIPGSGPFVCCNADCHVGEPPLHRSFYAVSHALPCTVWRAGMSQVHVSRQSIFLLVIYNVEGLTAALR